MNGRERLEAALAAESPFPALKAEAARLIAEVGREDAYAEVESFRAALETAARTDDENVIMNLLDCFAGWCGSGDEV